MEYSKSLSDIMLNRPSFNGGVGVGVVRASLSGSEIDLMIVFESCIELPSESFLGCKSLHYLVSALSDIIQVGDSLPLCFAPNWGNAPAFSFAFWVIPSASFIRLRY
jgi:hypothetical protein